MTINHHTYVILYCISRAATETDHEYFERVLAFLKSIHGSDRFWSASNGSMILETSRSIDKITDEIRSISNEFDYHVILEISKNINHCTVGDIVDGISFAGLFYN